MEFLAEYGLFLAKSVTVLVSVVVVIVVIVGTSVRSRSQEKGHIDVKSINDELEAISHNIKQVVLNEEALKVDTKSDKKRVKEDRKSRKKEAKEGVASRHNVFVVDFDGDIQASSVSGLREEITAILSIATTDDEVVIKLESPGGVVHGYGLAASQLQRIVSRNIPLTIAVDKVAASGGYMMACIGTKIIAAPFALLGSIGVVAQLPNFHRFLKNKEIDVEVLTAGEYKRTLTMFGENTEKGREKFVAELEDVHSLFKDFVGENRPVVELEKVATGEAWYGRRALEMKLVDELMTSDEYIIGQCDAKNVFVVKYIEHRSKMDKVLEKMSYLMTRNNVSDLFSKAQGPHAF